MASTDATDVAERDYGTVITFYSYKGGTGRSMALANTACLLSRRPEGGRVLMIDWDLEAPGLHRYFPEADTPAARRRPGLIEYFVEARRLLDAETDGGGSVPPPLETQDGRTAFTNRHSLEDHVTPNVVEGVDLLRAGRVGSREYASMVHGFDWADLHDRYRPLLDTFLDLVAGGWSYVLIDSRTGHTDIGGICTAILPEKLVTVFTPNSQSLRGLDVVVRGAVDYRRSSDDLRPLAIYPLPSRVDSSEEVLRREWRGTYQQTFEGLFAEVYRQEGIDLSAYFNAVQIPQKAYYAYGERVAVLEEHYRESLSLSLAYSVFCERLTESDAAWGDAEAGYGLDRDTDPAEQRRLRLVVLSSLVAWLVVGAGGVYWTWYVPSGSADGFGPVLLALLGASMGVIGSTVAGLQAVASRMGEGWLSRRFVRSLVAQPILAAALGAVLVLGLFSVRDRNGVYVAAALAALAGLFADAILAQLRTAADRVFAPDA